MINHVRTLLLNESSDQSPGADYPGEEYVPTGYLRRRPTAPARTALRALFGSTTDRAWKNFRLRQLLTAAHSSRLADHLLIDDARVTYWPLRDAPERWEAYGRASVTVITGEAEDLLIAGAAIVPETVGRCLSDWAVSYQDERVYISRDYPYYEADIAPDLSTGLSAQIPLPGTTVTFRVRDGIFGAWTVRVLSRPETSLAAVWARIAATDDAVIIAMFPSHAAEPIASQGRAWLECPFMAERLTAYLIGAARLVESSPLDV